MKLTSLACALFCAAVCAFRGRPTETAIFVAAVFIICAMPGRATAKGGE